MSRTAKTRVGIRSVRCRKVVVSVVVASVELVSGTVTRSVVAVVLYCFMIAVVVVKELKR